MENKVTETKVKEILEGVVSPLFDKIDERMAQISADVDVKVREAIKSETKMPKIEVGEDNLANDPKGGFKAMWHFARDVARAEKSGGRGISKELLNWETVCKAAGTGMLEGDDQYGGYLVPVEFRNTLINQINESNDLLPRCTSIPMATNIIEIPMVNGFDQSSGYVMGGMQALWTDEEAAYTEKRPKLGRLQLKLHKLTCLAYASEEILEDSPQSMETILMNGFTNAVNYQYNYVLIRGTGAGQPQGVLVSPAKVSVGKETGQAAATILFENLVKMYASIYDPAGAVWIANFNALPQLATMSLSVGTGGIPVWMPAGGASGKPYNTLFGLPLFFNDHCSTLGTQGDILLVNWRDYFIGRKTAGGDVRVDQSIHLKFDVGQVCYRLMTRLAGSCSWPQYFVPQQATTSYRSPVVMLDTRS